MNPTSHGSPAIKPNATLLDMPGSVRNDWHERMPSDVADHLRTNLNTGLTATEAAKRLEEYGPNKLFEKEATPLWRRIWNQLNNVLVLILTIVCVISVIKAATKSGQERTTNIIEVGLIAVVVVLNTWIGIKQEGDAEQSAAALKAMLSSAATVIRGGVKQEVPAEDVVVGDLIVVSTGDRIPADARVIEASALSCQEAALTGESVPVDKRVHSLQRTYSKRKSVVTVPLGDRNNMVFSATLVSQGHGTCIVVATGDNTQIGTINKMTNDVVEAKTRAEQQIDTFIKGIAAFVFLCAVTTFFVAKYHDNTSYIDAVSIALVAAVAMIPEGLAAIVSLTFSYGVKTMAKRNAIVRVLPAVETLGSVSVICSDKTGTLTTNLMTLVGLVTGNTNYSVHSSTGNRGAANFVEIDNIHDLISHHQEDATSSNEEDNTHHGVAAPEMVALTGKHGAMSGPASSVASPDEKFLFRSLIGAVLCNKAELSFTQEAAGDMDKDDRPTDIGNPTDVAILRGAHNAGMDYVALRKQRPVVHEVPFSSAYKFMATVHKPDTEYDQCEDDNMLVVHVKGAADRILSYSSSQVRYTSDGDIDVPVDSEHWNNRAHALSSQGLRVIALGRAVVPAADVAKYLDEHGQLKPTFISESVPFLTVVGLCAIVDPPRPECVASVRQAKHAGIRVCMITGDHASTALSIAEALGIVDADHTGAITGPELDDLDDDELRQAVMKYSVFARTSPMNKIQIVKALQAENQVTSMTGDGVNDAPALKAADIGVAMGKEGTDVARESSKVILADDNFSTIIAAVKVGRTVWANLRKVIFLNTIINNAQGLSVLGGMVVGMTESILSPIQVLYCNMICAVTLGMALAVEPPEEGIMDQKPRLISKRLIGRALLARIAFGTCLVVIGTIGSVFIIRDIDIDEYDIGKQRAQALNTLTLSVVSVSLSARFNFNSALHPRVFHGNRYCWYCAAIVITLQVFITHTPFINETVFEQKSMDGTQWGIASAAMVIVFIILEAEKAVRRCVWPIAAVGGDK